MGELIGRGSGRPFQTGQSGNPGGRLARSSADIARGFGAQVVRTMVKALFAPDAPFTHAGIANAYDLWCRCEGTVTDKFIIGDGRQLQLLAVQRTAPEPPADPAALTPADAFLPGLDALPDLDGKLPALPDETMRIPDAATLRAVVLRYLRYAQAVIVRGATAPGTERTSVGVTARRILLERGYGKVATTIEIEGGNSPGELHLAALLAANTRAWQDEAPAVLAAPALAPPEGQGDEASDGPVFEGEPEDLGAELWFNRWRQRR